MTIHPDQRYIDGLLRNDNLIIREIYKRFAARIKLYITRNNGSDEDAADIFQECLIDIYNQAHHRQLQLTCPFEPFFLLVCKRKWLNELKKRGSQPVTKNEIELSNLGEDVFRSAELVVEEEDRAKQVMAHFERLGEKCREILKLSLTGQAQEKIAEKLGVTYGYFRKKKSECLSTLIGYIKGNHH